MRQVLVFLGIAIVFSLASRTAMACTCGASATPCEGFGNAAAVFVGTVTGVRDNAPPQSRDVSERRKREDADGADWIPMAYKFSVEQSYLGVAGAEVEIFTGRGGGDCGVSFQTGQRYLVYASRYKDKLTTSICQRTKLFSQATEDIAFLGTLSSAPQGVTIYGTVGYPPVGPHRSSKPLSPDVLITIEDESAKKEIRPDGEGRFSVSGLRPGRYKVTLRLPETLTTYRTEEALTLADRGCGAVSWYVVDNGRVSGRVINANGEPVARILVSLVKPGDSVTESPIKIERTNDEGYVSFSAIPPGTYNIAVNYNRFPEPNDPTNAYPPSFYPGVLDQSHAQAITVGAGEKLSDFEVRIPSKQENSVLNGTVVWADSSPVANAQLLVRDETNSSNSLPYGIKADEQGRFKINGYSGQKLIILATGFDPKESPAILRISLERPTHTVQIVITKLR